MNAQIPLKLSTAGQQKAIFSTLLLTGSLSADTRSNHIAAGPDGWFCVHDAACALLCRVSEVTVTVWCAVLSRRRGIESVFTCVSNAELSDFTHECGPLERTANFDVLQSSENAVQNVSFIGQRLAIGTRGGSLALLDLPKDPISHFSGVSVPSLLHPCSLDLCVWSFYPDAALCAGLTAQGLWIYRAGDEQPTLSKWQSLSVGLPDLAAAAVCQWGSTEEVTLIACAAMEHKVVLFTANTASSSVEAQREYTLLDTPVDATLSPQCPPQCHLHPMHNEHGHLLAMVYPDSIIFCTVYEGEITCSAALRNELNLTFVSGSWTQHIVTRTREEFELSVTRSDGARLMYSVVVDKGQGRFCELVLNGYAILAHSACAELTTSASPPDSFWLSVSSIEDMLCNSPGAVIRYTSGDGQAPCTVVNRVRCPAAGAVLLLEIVESRGELCLLALLSTGDCQLVTSKGKVLVGTEDPAGAHAVTSIYAFDVAGVQYGVMGRQDGSIKFFVNGQPKAYLHMAHAGAVDQILLLPAYEYGSGDVDGALVMSVCSRMGTVCLHSGSSGDVVCILSSPSRPLSGCFFDRKSQYMRTFSGNAGNLWHIPTCRLERTFTCARQDLESDLDNLLRVHSSSVLRVGGVRFLGDMHFSIHIGVSVLAAPGDDAPAGSGGYERHALRSRDFTSALSLLLRSCQVNLTSSDESCQAIRTLSQLGFDAHTWDVPIQSLSLSIGPDASGRARCALFAMLSSLVTKRGDATLTAAAFQLALSLLDTAMQGKSPKEQACVLLGFYYAFFCTDHVPVRVPAAMARFGLQRLISSIDLAAVMPFLNPLDAENWRLCRSTATSMTPRINHGGSDGDSALSTHLFDACALTVLGLYCEGDGDETEQSPLVDAQQSRLEQAVLDTVRRFEEQYQQVQPSPPPPSLSTRTAAASQQEPTHITPETPGATEDLAYRLLPVVAGLPFARRFINEQEVVGRLCFVVFGITSWPTLTDQAHVTFDLVLQCAVAHDIDHFLSATIRPLYMQKPAWRVRILVFLTALIRNYPFPAYRAAAGLVEFAVAALDPQTPEKDDKAMCTAAVAEMLRVAVATLPNVSFQQSLQQLAVGDRNGDIKVYSLRTATLVTSFAAHTEAVMAVSYSSNTSSYDIAVVPESMAALRLWRAAKPGSGLTSFLAGYTVHFKCMQQVNLPRAAISDASMPALLPLCTLKWISPQCIWFISPWHGKIEMSLAH